MDSLPALLPMDHAFDSHPNIRGCVLKQDDKYINIASPISIKVTE